MCCAGYCLKMMHRPSRASVFLGCSMSLGSNPGLQTNLERSKDATGTWVYRREIGVSMYVQDLNRWQLGSACAVTSESLAWASV